MNCSLAVLVQILLYGSHCFSVQLPSKHMKVKQSNTHNFTKRLAGVYTDEGSIFNVLRIVSNCSNFFKLVTFDTFRHNSFDIDEPTVPLNYIYFFKLRVLGLMAFWYTGSAFHQILQSYLYTNAYFRLTRLTLLSIHGCGW